MQTVRIGIETRTLAVGLSLALLSGACASPKGQGTDEIVQQAAEAIRRGGVGGGVPEAPGEVPIPPFRAVSRIAPVVLADVSRDPALFEDFIRFTYVDKGVVPTAIARQGVSLRAFMTASFFFNPPLPLENAVDYVGTPDEPPRNFVAIRCRSPRARALEAVLATWPNVFQLLQQDFGAQFSCPAGASLDNQLLCIAQEFVDTPTPNVTVGLANTFDVAAQIMQSQALADDIERIYGIHRPFSGIGYAVKGTASNPPITTEEALRNAIAPEYLVRNVTFKEGGCRCIEVAPYPGRSDDPIDPDFVWREGGTEQCRFVDRLRSTRGQTSPVLGEPLVDADEAATPPPAPPSVGDKGASCPLTDERERTAL